MSDDIFMPLVRWAILQDKVPRTWLENLHNALHTLEMQKSFDVDKKLSLAGWRAKKGKKYVKSPKYYTARH